MLRYAPLNWLYGIWDKLSRQSAVGSPKLQSRYAHFCAGTPINQIERWLSQMNPAFLPADLASGIRDEEERVVKDDDLQGSRTLDLVIAPFVETEARQRWAESCSRGKHQPFCIEVSDVHDALTALGVRKPQGHASYTPALIDHLLMTMRSNGYTVTPQEA